MENTKVLGLDLGTNSIGSGIVLFNKSNINNSEILFSGVRIFPEGITKDSHGKEISRNQKRREKRQQRRIYYRRKQTIESIILELLNTECFPNLSKIEGLGNVKTAIINLSNYFSINDIEYLYKKFKSEHVINQNYLSLFITKIIQHYGLTTEDKDETNPTYHAITLLKEFFQKNPYELRNIAIKNMRELSHFELGRILYHFSQRKGFQSSAKNQREKDKDEEGFYGQLEGLLKEVKENGFNFYGEYFYHLQQQGKKVRKQPTIRKELIREFNKIWETQKQNPNFKNLLTGEIIDPYEDEKIKSEIKERNRGTWYERICDKIIYYQRPLKSQKYLVGLCSLERYSVQKDMNGKSFLFHRGKTRCPISALSFEEYRMLCEINNIKIIIDGVERNLENFERDYLISLYNQYNKKQKFNLSKFAKDKLPAGTIITGIADKNSLPEINAFQILKDCFGNNWPKDEKKQKKIWWELYFALVEAKEESDEGSDEENVEKEEKKNKWTLAIANEKNKWNLSDDSIEKIEQLFSFRGDTEIIANPSHSQLKKLFGEQWDLIPYRRIKEFGKKKNKEGFEHIVEKKKNDNDKNIYREDIWHALYYHDNKEWLRSTGENKWNLTDEQIEYLKTIKLKQGFANLSLNAIEKILVYLRKGYRRDKAIFMANLQEVFKYHLQSENITWDDFNKEEKIDEAIIDILDRVIPKQLKFNRVLNNIVSLLIKSDSRFPINIEGILDKTPEHYEFKEEKPAIEIEWNEFDKEQQNILSDEIKKVSNIRNQKPIDFKKGDYFFKTPRQENAIKIFLSSNYPFLTEKDLDKLYHPSQIDSYPKSERLGSPLAPSLNNPVVIQTLYELRHLVNELIDRKLINPHTDKVRVEMSRELNDKSKRAAYRKWQNNRYELWDKYEEKLKEIFSKDGRANYIPNEYDLLKYFLWRELDIVNAGCCPYTGDKICFEKLFGDNATIDIEHIIPYSLSCDDSLENLTLCNNTFNRDIKKNQLPSQLQNHKEILQRVEKWKKIYLAIGYKLKKLKTEIKQLTNIETEEAKRSRDIKKFQYEMAKIDFDYYRRKYDKFIIKPNKIDDKFKNRQLPDTGYINRLAVQYLKSVFYDRENEKSVRVFSVSAKAVEQFRRLWGLQPENEKKDRSEHYHHAKDAILTACMEKGIYDKMAKFIHEYGERWYQWDFYKRPKFRTPWKNFILDVEKSIHKIIVSHKQDNKLITISEKKVNGKSIKSIAVRGQLHDDNYYGKIKNPYNKNENVLVKRDELKNLSIDKLMNIADKGILSIVLDVLNKKINPENPIFKINKKPDENGKLFVESFEIIRDINKELEESIKVELSQEQFFTTIRKSGKTHGANIGKKIPVKSVKIISKSDEDKFRSIYNSTQTKFVKPGNNYSIGIYGGDFPEYNGRSVTNRDFETITFIDAVKNPNFTLPSQLGKLPLLMTLMPDDYVLAYDEDESEIFFNDKKLSENQNTISEINFVSKRLLKLLTIDQKSIIVFQRHYKAVKEANKAPSVSGKIINGFGDVLRRRYSTFIGFKVNVDRLGNIKPAQ